MPQVRGGGCVRWRRVREARGGRAGIGKTLLTQLVLEKLALMADQTSRSRKDMSSATAAAPTSAPVTPLLVSASAEYRPAALAHAYLRRGFGGETLGYVGVGSGGAGGHSQWTAVRNRLKSKGAVQARRTSKTHALDGRVLATPESAADAPAPVAVATVVVAATPRLGAGDAESAAAAGAVAATAEAAAPVSELANVTLRSHFTHLDLSKHPIAVHETDTRTVLLCTSFNALAAAAAAPGARDNPLYALVRANCAAHKGARLRPVPGVELRVFIDDVGGGGGGGAAAAAATLEQLRALVDHCIVYDRADRAWKQVGVCVQSVRCSAE